MKEMLYCRDKRNTEEEGGREVKEGLTYREAPMCLCFLLG